MAAIDRTNYKRIQRSYYNVNIYNDTNDVIECKYSANMIVPLLDKPNQYEVSVVRASVPLDGIPISQVNIGFESWQVQFTNTQTNQTSNAYVSQFNPTPAYLEYYDLAIIGFIATDLQVILIPAGIPPAINIPSGDVPLSLQTYNNSTVQQTNLVNSPNLSNIAYAKSYYYVVDSLTTLNAYEYGDNRVANNLSIYGNGLTNAQIFAICATRSSDIFFVLAYDLTISYLTIAYFQGAGSFAPTVFYMASVPSSVSINSFSCNGTYLSVSVQDGNTCQIYNYSTPSAELGAPTLLANQPAAVTDFKIYTYVDVNNIYYQAPVRQNLGLRSPDFRSYDINNPNGAWINIYAYNNQDRTFTRFLGNDIYDNIMACFTNAPDLGGGFRIEAYNVSTPRTACDYYITTPTEPYSLRSVFSTISITVPEGPSLTPNYQIWNYQTYLDQINIAIATAFNGIAASTGWPSQEVPYLSYSDSKFSLNCGVGLASPVCIMSFNTRLWQRFIFNSKTNTTNPNYEDIQILNLIPNIVPATPPSAFLMITQPHNSNYRWFDITRIIVRSNKMSVAGDVELTNTSLLNITDFAVDTSAPDVLLQIYEPAILRYYQLYQTSPLNAVDVQLSYSTRSGDIYPIYLTAGSSGSIKLLFRRSNFQLAL